MYYINVKTNNAGIIQIVNQFITHLPRGFPKMLRLFSPAVILGLLLSLFTAVTYFLKRRYSFWTSKTVPQIEPRMFLGNFTMHKEDFSTQLEKLYKHFKKQGAKYFGCYFFLRPVFIPIDQELIKHLLVKDFEYLMNHSSGRTRKNEPLTGHLLNIEGSRWKSMRATLTPTFTSGKMKMMFQTFVECTKGLEDILGEYAITKEAMDVKEVLGRFTTDIIGSCAFGLECNTLKNPDSDFRKYGKKIVENSPFSVYKIIAFRMVPKRILEFLNLKFQEKDIEEFFINLVKDVVEYRESSNIFRQDFMHLLLQLKNRGKVSDDGQIKGDENVSKSIFDMNDVIANCFVFFVAGFETSSTAMTFTLYELAANKDIQTKLRKEIDSVMEKHENKLSYDAIQEMGYLDMVLKESLRRHPPVGITTREINKDYTVPGTNIILEKGTSIQIPIRGIHLDEEYYPDPEKFDPERFTTENKAKRPAFSWMPFGDGPRQCIGLRFGILQSKVGLVTMIRNYEVSLNERTPVPLVLDPNAFTISSVLDGVWLNVSKIH